MACRMTSTSARTDPNGSLTDLASSSAGGISKYSASRSGNGARSVIPQSVWCRMTRFQSPGRCVLALAAPTLPSIAIVRSVAGVIRPPTFLMMAASPLRSPGTWAGSTRGSTQPTTIMLPDGLMVRSALNSLAANSALRWIRSCGTVIDSSFGPASGAADVGPRGAADARAFSQHEGRHANKCRSAVDPDMTCSSAMARWFALESADAGFFDIAPHVFHYEKHFAAPPEQ